MEYTFAASTATVVTFMPPAVEPGAPPMSMRKIITARDTSLMAARSVVLKPAVRGVADWKIEARRRSCGGRAEYSVKKKSTAGKRSSAADVARITLLCIR